MADNMMRTAGRTEEGLAKSISLKTDPNGNGVQRVVDAAPHAYDAEKDAKRVTIVDSEGASTNSKVRQVKLIESSAPITIQPGERHRFTMNSAYFGGGTSEFVAGIPAIDLYQPAGNKGKYTLRFDLKNTLEGDGGPMMVKLFEYSQDVEDYGMTGIATRFPFFLGDRLLRCQITNDGTTPFTIYNIDLFLFKE